MDCCSNPCGIASSMGLQQPSPLGTSLHGAGGFASVPTGAPQIRCRVGGRGGFGSSVAIGQANRRCGMTSSIGHLQPSPLGISGRAAVGFADVRTSAPQIRSRVGGGRGFGSSLTIGQARRRSVNVVGSIRSRLGEGCGFGSSLAIGQARRSSLNAAGSIRSRLGEGCGFGSSLAIGQARRRSLNVVGSIRSRLGEGCGFGSSLAIGQARRSSLNAAGSIRSRLGEGCGFGSSLAIGQARRRSLNAAGSIRSRLGEGRGFGRSLAIGQARRRPVNAAGSIRNRFGRGRGFGSSFAIGLAGRRSENAAGSGAAALRCVRACSKLENEREESPSPKMEEEEKKEGLVESIEAEMGRQFGGALWFSVLFVCLILFGGGYAYLVFNYADLSDIPILRQPKR